MQVLSRSLAHSVLISCHIAKTLHFIIILGEKLKMLSNELPTCYIVMQNLLKITEYIYTIYVCVCVCAYLFK